MLQTYSIVSPRSLAFLEASLLEIGFMHSSCLETRSGLHLLTLLDTFDWRIWARGSRFWLQRLDEDYRMRLEEQPSGAVVAQARGPKTPRFATDLEAHQNMLSLRKTIGIRALLPQLDVEVEWSRLVASDASLNNEGEVLLQSYRVRLRHEGAPWKQLRLRLVFAGEAHAQSVIADLREYAGGQLDVDVEPPCWVEEALALLAIVPAQFDPRINVRIEPASTIEDAMLKLFDGLWNTFLQNEPGTIADIDTEFLHQFRVAIRRMRSVLSQFQGIISPKDERRFRRALKRLGQTTGPCRDLDVLGLALEGYFVELKISDPGLCRKIRQHLRKQRQKQHRLLRKSLMKKRYGRFKVRFSKWRAKPSFQESASTGPAHVYAKASIQRALEDLLGSGRAINGDSSDEKLHELRKKCKILRYLLEFFRSLFPKKSLIEMLKSLKGLQKLLGTFQDLSVHGPVLRQCTKTLEDGLSNLEQARLDYFFEEFEKKKLTIRRKCLAAFNGFDTPETGFRMRALVGTFDV